MSVIATSFYTVWLLLVAIYALAIAILLSAPARKMGQSHLEYFPRVSLVIPTYNEASVITQKLDNVLQLEYPRDKLEVMVVDGGSTDSTREKVKGFAEANFERLNIALIEQPTRRGKSAAINDALRLSECEVFALTDADVVVKPQALAKLVSHLIDQNVGGASGIEVPIGDQSLMFQVEEGYKKIYAATRMSEASLDTPLMCESEFSVFYRKAITPLKQGCMCDDLELTVNLRSHGMKAVYVSDAPFYEREAGALKPKLLHKYRRGMANQHGLLRAWRVLFNKSFGKYGNFIFPYEFFVHIISPILLVLAIALFIGSLIESPSVITIEAATAISSGLFPLILLRQLTRKYKTNDILSNTGRLSWLLGAVAFLAFQIVLVASLAHLVLRGPKLQWAQISETRRPTTTEFQTVPAGL